MSSNLNGLNLVIVGSEERLVEELFAQLSIQAFGATIQVATTEDELPDPEQESLLMILDSQISRSESWVDTILARGVDPDRLILGIPKNSVAHRILSRRLKCERFTYEELSGPLGKEVEMDSPVQTILRAWERIKEESFHGLVKQGFASGAIPLICHALNLDHAIPRERASIARSLADKVNKDLEFEKTVAKNALYWDLKRIQNYKKVLEDSSHLWDFDSSEIVSRIVGLSDQIVFCDHNTTVESLLSDLSLELKASLKSQIKEILRVKQNALKTA